MEGSCSFGPCQPISDILGIRSSAGLSEVGSLTVLMEAHSAYAYRTIQWWRQNVIWTVACRYRGHCQLLSILWVTGPECILFRSAHRGLLWAETVHHGVGAMCGRIQNAEGPLFSHIGLESWVYGSEKLCHCVLQNCFRSAKWSGVFQVTRAQFWQCVQTFWLSRSARKHA